MTEKAKLLNSGFSVADAEQPQFTFTGDEVVLTFTDWQENDMTVRFKDCVAVKWQEADSKGPEARDDCTYEILGSDWLKVHLKQNMVTPDEGHRHFKLCFNAVGVLEVIATQMDAQPSASQEP